MKINDVINIIEKDHPQTLSDDYCRETGCADNYGLMVGDRNDEFKKMIVTLDLTYEAIDYAIKQKANLIFTHHPIVFSPLYHVNTDSVTENLIIKCIKNGINVYASHLTQDLSNPGTNYSLMNELGLSNPTPYEYDRMGLVCEYGKTLKELVKEVKEKLHCNHIRYVGSDNKLVKKVLIIGGSCTSTCVLALQDLNNSIDAIITGEVKYHTALEMSEKDIGLIELTHQTSEEYFGKYVAQELKEKGLDAEEYFSKRIYKTI